MFIHLNRTASSATVLQAFNSRKPSSKSWNFQLSLKILCLPITEKGASKIEFTGQHTVTDNGPQFVSYEYSHFSCECRFTSTKSSPYHSQGKRRAESVVKIAKNILKESRHCSLSLPKHIPTRIRLFPCWVLDIPKTSGHYNHSY